MRSEYWRGWLDCSLVYLIGLMLIALTACAPDIAQIMKDGWKCKADITMPDGTVREGVEVWVTSGGRTFTATGRDVVSGLEVKIYQCERSEP